MSRSHLHSQSLCAVTTAPMSFPVIPRFVGLASEPQIHTGAC